VPRDAETLTSLGRLHLSAGRTAPAVAALQRALTVDASNSQALRALGEALIRAGRTAEGQQRLEESVRRQAQELEEQRSLRTVAMLTMQAEIHMSQDEYAAAIDVFTQAIAVRRDRVSPLRLADALIKAGRLEDAAGLLRNATTTNGGPETYRRLADVYAALGRKEESATARRTYVEKRLQELAAGID